jgi:hypothetical protein
VAGRFGGHVQSLGGYSQYSSREPMGPPPLPLGQRGSIGPPPALSQRSSHYSPYGPDVRLPMGSSLAANRSLSTSTSSSGYGYTENHASYREVRLQRQQLAYAPTSDHRIMLEFRGVTRKPGRVTAEIIGVCPVQFLSAFQSQNSKGYVPCSRQGQGQHWRW